MSGAILYLAIIIIWACVLIPRWLRRDPARGSSQAPGVAIAGEMAPATAGPEHRVSAPVAASFAASVAAPVPAPVGGGSDEWHGDAAEDAPEQDDAPPPLTREEANQRMMAARRRLLAMLIALESAAITLAVLGVAALWVVIPPSVMLIGYLLLLREAAHADAERARREHEAAAARARARARANRRASAAPAVPGRAAALAAPVARAAGEPDFEDAGPGRDFAPGLAGKYTTSNAEIIPIPERASEDSYGDYRENKLRAVGD